MTGPDDRNLTVAGVAIKVDGYKRSPADIARDFMTPRSPGLYGAILRERDIASLAELLSAYARAHDGPIIAPLTFGGNECLCEGGTETWCKAHCCPRQPTPSPDPDAPHPSKPTGE